jgi:hypothetical protein
MTDEKKLSYPIFHPEWYEWVLFSVPCPGNSASETLPYFSLVAIKASV